MFDWFSGDAGVENVTVSDGFNYGPWAGGLESGYSFDLNLPSPDGLVASQNRADNEWSWFDQSKLTATFSDVLNAGIGAAKTALDQEIRGSKKNTGQSFYDVLKNSALDRFSSSKTGKEIRSEVLASQVRTFFSNPLYMIVTLAGLAFLILVVMRRG